MPSPVIGPGSTQVSTADQSPTIPGVEVLESPVFRDHRGLFTSPFVTTPETAPLFDVRQVSFSHSCRGVPRGVHYTRSPPGCEKLVFCSHGDILDIVVDLRPGSPTFGKWNSLQLGMGTGGRGHAVRIPSGVGHAFVALTDDACMTYLLSKAYVPQDEWEINLWDNALGLSAVLESAGADRGLLSDRDRSAPGLERAAAERRLPTWRHTPDEE